MLQGERLHTLLEKEGYEVWCSTQLVLEGDNHGDIDGGDVGLSEDDCLFSSDSQEQADACQTDSKIEIYIWHIVRPSGVLVIFECSKLLYIQLWDIVRLNLKCCVPYRSLHVEPL